MKIAIMVDSSIGLTEKECRQKGLFFVPIVIDWNGKERLSGVDIDLDYMYENLNKDTKFGTAACKMSHIEEEYKKALKDNDHVVYIPISKHLSSTINTARIVAENFKGKVTIYDSEFIGPWLLLIVDILSNLTKNASSLEEVIKVIDESSEVMTGWLFPHNLERLYASGRMSKSQYLAGSLLKVTPVLTVEDGKLDKYPVKKTKSPTKAINYIYENCMNAISEFQRKGMEYKLVIITLGKKENNEYVDEFLSKFKDIKDLEIEFLWLPPAILGHVGKGGIGAGITKKIKIKK